MRIKRVAECHVTRVVHDHRQVVLCGHAWAEDVLIALVAVVGLDLEVKRLQPGVTAQVQFPRTVWALVGATAWTRRHPACRSVLGPVEPHSAAGIDLSGSVSKPPVHE